jgi:hypothetical protein
MFLLTASAHACPSQFQKFINICINPLKYTLASIMPNQPKCLITASIYLKNERRMKKIANHHIKDSVITSKLADDLSIQRRLRHIIIQYTIETKLHVHACTL